MSYILEALRRSQAERERGQVPGLGAQPISAPSSSARPRRVPTSLWWLVAASVLVLMVAAAVLSSLWTRRTVAAPALPATAQATGPALAAATTVVPAVQQPVQQPAQPSLPQPAQPSVQQPTQLPAVTAVRLPTVVSAPPAPAPAAQQTGGSTLPATTLARSATAAPTVAAAPAPAVPGLAPSVATTPAPAVAADARPIPYAQLSAEQRRELPPLQVSGSIWSDNAASRFVMLNGMVVREGDVVAPGLKLERIAQKSAVLRWRDLRFEIGL